MTDSDDADALIAALEDDEATDSTLAALRERRRQQLQVEFAQERDALRRDADHDGLEHGRGAYDEITDEKVLMDAVTATPRCLVHFFEAGFQRCTIVDAHLENLARHHPSTRFLRLAASRAPFLADRLKVRVLPCVIAFADGIAVDRLVGFAGLGSAAGSDSFASRDLEAWLVRCGVVDRARLTGAEARFRADGGEAGTTAGGRRNEEVDEDEGDDWD